MGDSEGGNSKIISLAEKKREKDAAAEKPITDLAADTIKLSLIFGLGSYLTTGDPAAVIPKEQPYFHPEGDPTDFREWEPLASYRVPIDQVSLVEAALQGFCTDHPEWDYSTQMDSESDGNVRTVSLSNRKPNPDLAGDLHMGEPPKRQFPPPLPQHPPVSFEDIGAQLDSKQASVITSQEPAHAQPRALIPSPTFPMIPRARLRIHQDSLGNATSAYLVVDYAPNINPHGPAKITPIGHK